MCWHSLRRAKQTVEGSQKERDCRVNLSSSDAGRPQSSFREGHIVMPNQVCIKLNNAVAWNWKPKSKSTPQLVLQDKAIKTLSLFFSLSFFLSPEQSGCTFTSLCGTALFSFSLMLGWWYYWWCTGTIYFWRVPKVLWSREAILLLGQGRSARGPLPARGCKVGILVVLSPWVPYR